MATACVLSGKTRPERVFDWPGSMRQLGTAPTVKTPRRPIEIRRSRPIDPSEEAPHDRHEGW